MNRMKRTLAALMAAMTLFGFMPALTPRAAAAVYYNDIAGHWAYDAISRWNQEGSLADFPAGAFRPDAYITRAEFFSLLVRTLGATAEADVSQFSDLNPNSWYYDIVAIACGMGIAGGGADGLMRPNGYLERQDAATLVARALGISSANTWTLSRFSDAASVSAYAAAYVAGLVEKGLMQGGANGTFAPHAYMRRSEAVKLIDNIFSHIYKPETPISNVYLTGGLLIAKPDAQIRDMVIYGDVVIGDGVGSGNALLADCTINGRLIVRGGGPYSVTISNTTVRDGVFVASYGADTRVAVTDHSFVPEIQTVSGFTLSGGGVKKLTVLDSAREGAVINLNSVSLDELSIGGRGATVRLISGRAGSARFETAGQRARLEIYTGATVEYLAVAAPDVSVSGAGNIHSLLVNNTGAVVTQKPEFSTVGVNLTANIAGTLVSGPMTTSPNGIDRVNDGSLEVRLLPGTSSGAPFDQSQLSSAMSAGRSATEINVTQAASRQIPLTSRHDRLAYWVGFSVPVPNGAANSVSITYMYADGEPVTLSVPLSTNDRQRGLQIYLPVFREPGKDYGQLKETLYINWGGGLTENLQFMSNTLALTPLSAAQQAALQADFDAGRLRSINGSTEYIGAEAVRRILSSDNPLGLPNRSNKGLDAVNRASTLQEVRDILEERGFAADLTIDTSGNSPYSKLSDKGKAAVAEAVLSGRKSSYLTPSAVKTIFDKTVNTILAAETALLAAINAAGDAAALRKVIETPANAVRLDFQTGAAPYKNYSTAQKDAMALALFNQKSTYALRAYPSLQEVIDAIRRYLDDNPQDTPGPGSETVSSVAVSPSTLSFAVTNQRDITITVRTSGTTTGVMSNANIDATAEYSFTTGLNSAFVDVVGPVKDGKLTLRAKAVGKETLTVTVGGKTARVSITVTPQVLATGIKINVNDLKLLTVPPNNTYQLLATLTPAAATDTIKWSSKDPAIAQVSSGGLVTGISRGVTEIVAETENGYSAICRVMVFQDQDDVVVDPSEIILTPGASQKVTAYTYGVNKRLFWESDDPNVEVDQTGVITAQWGARPTEENPITAKVTVSVAGSANAAVVNVTVKASTGVTIWLRNAVMYSGDTQQLNLNIINQDMRNQKFYVQVVGGVGGVAARLVNNQSTGLTINDIITIQALSTGVGEATIRLFNNPSFTGEPIAETKVIVSPMSVDGVSFDHSGTSVLPNYAKGTISESSYGFILEMKLADRTAVTPMQSLTGSLTDRVRLTQPMTWFSYVCDYNQEILLEVRTVYESGIYYIVDKQGGRIEGNVNFLTAFRPDEETDPVANGTISVPGNGEYVRRRGFFHRLYDDNMKKVIQRDADHLKVPSTLLNAGGGNLAPDSSQPTGFAAVAMTPSRGNLTSAQWSEWGGLFFDTVSLFVGGQVNPVIARQSGFKLQIQIGTTGEWRDATAGDTYTDPYRIPQSEVTAGRYRVTDVNGRPLSSQVPAIVIGDPNATSNIFYVRVLPNDINKPANSTRTTDWVAASAETPSPVYRAQIAVVPGSKDKYYSPPEGVADMETRPESLIARAIEANSREPENAFITQLDTTTYLMILDTLYPISPPVTPRNYSYMYNIEQYSKLGFAPQGVDGHANPSARQKPVMSATGNLPNTFVTYTLTINPPNTVIEPIGMTVGDLPRDLRNESSVRTAAAILGINLDAASTTFISSNAGVLSNGPIVTAVAAGTAEVTINDSGKTMKVPFVVAAASVVPGFAPVQAGVSMPAVDLPGVVPAAQSAGIDPATANIQSATPALLTIDASGTAALIAPGQALITVLSPDGAKSAGVTLEIEPPYVVPKSVKLRSTAAVTAGGTLSLLPYFDDPHVDPATLVWTTSNAAIATVDAKGLVTGVKAGKATIKVTVTGTKLSASCTVTVAAPGVGAASVALSKATLALSAGKTSTLTVKYTPSNAAGRGVTWRSSNEKVARVSPTGIVTGTGAGTVTITAVCDLTGAEDKCVVTVTVPVTGVILSAKTLSLKVGATDKFGYTINPNNATNQAVTWKSSNTKVAVIDENGVVTAMGAGTATITITTVDGKKTATCKVTVTK